MELQEDNSSFRRSSKVFRTSIGSTDQNEDIYCINRIRRKTKESFEEVPWYAALMAYIGYIIIMCMGYLNKSLFPPKHIQSEKSREGYAILYNQYEYFYLNYVYRRCRDCWDRPICSVPGAEVVLKDRVSHDYGWSFKFTGSETKCFNLGSYNYLGFGQASGPCADASAEAIRKYGLASCSSRLELGKNPLHVELEELTARFLGVEAAITFGMGYGTNTLNLPCLLSPGCLVISDEKNHISLIVGLRLSGAKIKVFKHNDMKHLEEVLIDSIAYGQPRTHRPWKKILIVVEGIYSMEGSIVHLPELIELKKKYKAYVYIDEAHSIGALGYKGRGAADYHGCNPRDIDILMGTFTKSFGSAGGYLGGSKALIEYLRVNSHGQCYGTSMSPPVCQQIITSMKIIMGEDGTKEGERRLLQLRDNSRYFRQRLNQIGVIIYGNDDSPVVPLLVYMMTKIIAVVRILATRNIAVVGVGFPATPLFEGRIRICLSAAHTKEQLDYALDTIDKLANEIGLKYSRKPRSPLPIIYGDDREENYENNKYYPKKLSKSK